MYFSCKRAVIFQFCVVMLQAATFVDGALTRYATFTVCSSANFLLYCCYVAGCHICRWGTHSSTGNRIFHLNGFSHSRLCHLTNGFALTWSPIMIMIMMISLMVMTSIEIIMMNNEKWKWSLRLSQSFPSHLCDWWWFCFDLKCHCVVLDLMAAGCFQVVLLSWFWNVSHDHCNCIIIDDLRKQNVIEIGRNHSKSG